MPAGAALEFVELCRRKRILFVVFVRHANAAPLREGAASREQNCVSRFVFHNINVDVVTDLALE